MQPFEFVMILVSLIVGLGITQILAGLVRLMRGELEGYWIHSVWILNVSLLLLSYSWSQFAAESKTDWIFLELVKKMTPPILLYLVASLLFPAREEDPNLRVSTSRGGGRCSACSFCCWRSTTLTNC